MPKNSSKNNSKYPVGASHGVAADAEKPKAQGKFLTGSLMRHVAVMTLTSSFGLLAMFLVDFADLFFIAQLGDPQLTAAMGYAATLLFLNSALNVGLMITISALGSRQIGAGNGECLPELTSQITLLGVVMGGMTSLLFWIFAPEIMVALGAKGTALTASVEYIRITAPFTPLTIIGMVGSGVLRAHGDARRAMNVTLAMAIGNAVFDPILMFGFKMGFTGAAVATVISIFMMAATAVIPVVRIYGGYAKVTREGFARNMPAIKRIMGPVVLTNLATPIGGMILFRLMSSYGADAVAALAVINRIVPLAFSLLFSLSGAVGPPLSAKIMAAII